MSVMDPETLAQGRFLELLSRDGWEYVHRRIGRSVVAVIALDADDRLILVEQFRPAVGTTVIELPAGLIGDQAESSEEDAESAARRELMEETGFEAGSWKRLPSVVSSAGLTDERIDLFLARDLLHTGPGGGVDDERIVVHLVPISELTGFLAARLAEGSEVDGRVYAAPTLAGV